MDLDDESQRVLIAANAQLQRLFECVQRWGWDERCENWLNAILETVRADKWRCQEKVDTGK